MATVGAVKAAVLHFETFLDGSPVVARGSRDRCTASAAANAAAADEEAVLCAGEEPETSDTSVDVDMGESIGAVLVPPPADTGTFCFE